MPAKHRSPYRTTRIGGGGRVESARERKSTFSRVFVILWGKGPSRYVPGFAGGYRKVSGMAKRIELTVSEAEFALIERARGLVPRAAYIRRMLFEPIAVREAIRAGAETVRMEVGSVMPGEAEGPGVVIREPASSRASGGVSVEEAREALSSGVSRQFVPAVACSECGAVGRMHQRGCKAAT